MKNLFLILFIIIQSFLYADNIDNIPVNDGLLIKKYDSGQIKSEGFSFEVEKKEHLFIKEYYENGKLKSIISKINGKLDGVSVLYLPNGEIKLIEQTKNGKRHGKYILFKKGKISEVLSFVDGEKHGQMLSYYENGFLKSAMYAIHGKLNGKSVFYYNNGKVFLTMEYKKDKIVGRSKLYYVNGRLGAEKIYKLFGTKQFFHNKKGDLVIGKKQTSLVFMDLIKDAEEYGVAKEVFDYIGFSEK